MNPISQSGRSLSARPLNSCAAHNALAHRGPWEGESSDGSFLRLTEELRAHGGILPLEELRALCHVGNPGFGLAESIMRGDVFTLMWRRQIWVPCFQFIGTNWTPCKRVFSITAEVRPAIQGEDLALWFIEPSPWLRGETPLSLVHSETERVRQAARIDRFAVSH
jgi:hypothetical protein